MQSYEVTLYTPETDNDIPNNPILPVLIYAGGLKGKEHSTEEIFYKNGWTNSWTNGIFRYHHYHSNTHEVLGVISGWAKVRIGGESGKDFILNIGDVIVLPAGTGHKNLENSSDFKVTGAYPDCREPNLLKVDSSGFDKEIEQIKAVKVPQLDPIAGSEGPLVKYWI